MNIKKQEIDMLEDDNYRKLLEHMSIIMSIINSDTNLLGYFENRNLKYPTTLEKNCDYFDKTIIYLSKMVLEVFKKDTFLIQSELEFFVKNFIKNYDILDSKSKFIEEDYYIIKINKMKNKDLINKKLREYAICMISLYKIFDYISVHNTAYIDKMYHSQEV